MTKTRAKPSEVRDFILTDVGEHPVDISRRVQEHFGISRQAASRHLQKLIDAGELIAEGQTKGRRYRLPATGSALPQQQHFEHPANALDEDRVWRSEIAPLMVDLPENVRDIWHYACTEMINNVHDHADAKAARIEVGRTAKDAIVRISDDGIGLFKRIRDAFGLEDLRHAVLELSKGKLTTDPANHSGEGIFFSSRAVDVFSIYANGLFAEHRNDDDRDWMIDDENTDGAGTVITLRLASRSSRRLEDVFDEWTVDKDEPVFSRTVIPVHLLRYGKERLVSRSQAKRLLARLDRFSSVMLDFSGVESIGQAFADEIFRVFARNHPDIELIPLEANENVMKMIQRARIGNALLDPPGRHT